jgi:hypothetical protein
MHRIRYERIVRALPSRITYESDGLHNHGGPVAQDLGGADHRSRVVANADDCVCTEFSSVRYHQLEGFLACGFTKLGENPRPSPKNSSQRAQNTQGQRPRSHGNSTDNSKRLGDAKSRQLKRRGGMHDEYCMPPAAIHPEAMKAARRFNKTGRFTAAFVLTY